MDKTILQNQLLMMKALQLLVSDPELARELKAQITFTEARLRAMA